MTTQGPSFKMFQTLVVEKKKKKNYLDDLEFRRR